MGENNKVMRPGETAAERMLEKLKNKQSCRAQARPSGCLYALPDALGTDSTITDPVIVKKNHLAIGKKSVFSVF